MGIQRTGVRADGARAGHGVSVSGWTELVAAAGSADPALHRYPDATADRLLDAAVAEAAHVGLQRVTVEDVVRRAGMSRMTAYRRYPRRDDLIQALVARETQRFLAAVADGIEAASDPRDGVVEAFIAAVRFSRAHPMLRRAGQTDSALPAADTARLLATGSAFIAGYLQRAVSGPGTAGPPPQQVRWVADVFARLFLSYVSTPPTDPDFGAEAQLRCFADEVLAPMVERLR